LTSDCDNGADLESQDIIVLDDEDDPANSRATQHASSNLQSDYLPQAANAAIRLPATAAFPGSRVVINPSVVPEMIFTLQNGNAVLMQQPSAVITGAAYTPTMRLVSPVAVAANNIPVQAQVS